jgi:hypothetical protein
VHGGYYTTITHRIQPCITYFRKRPDDGGWKRIHDHLVQWSRVDPNRLALQRLQVWMHKRFLLSSSTHGLTQVPARLKSTVIPVPLSVLLAFSSRTFLSSTSRTSRYTFNFPGDVCAIAQRFEGSSHTCVHSSLK